MKNKAIKTVVFCLIFFSSLNGIAQGPGAGTAETTGDLAMENTSADAAAAAASPINDYIIPMLLLGAVLGYSLLKRKTNPAR
jgi:hypothetical protein